MKVLVIKEHENDRGNVANQQTNYQTTNTNYQKTQANDGLQLQR